MPLLTIKVCFRKAECSAKTEDNVTTEISKIDYDEIFVNNKIIVALSRSKIKLRISNIYVS